MKVIDRRTQLIAAGAALVLMVAGFAVNLVRSRAPEDRGDP